MELDGYEDVQVNDTDFVTLPPDGYVCKIINAEIVKVNDRHQLRLQIDIAEGKYKDFYKDKFTRTLVRNGEKSEWDFNAIFKRYIFDEGKVSPRFKAVIEAVRKSNENYKFNPRDFDEKSLVGQLCGFTFLSREVEGKNGNPNFFVTRIGFPMSIDKIREGNFKIPKPELLKPTETGNTDDFNGKNFSDDDMPF